MHRANEHAHSEVCKTRTAVTNDVSAGRMRRTRMARRMRMARRTRWTRRAVETVWMGRIPRTPTGFF